MIFFLDDDRARTKTFLSNVPQARCVEKASEMIDLLSKNEATIVFLDHDLGGEQFVDSNREDCGMEVVRWVVTNRPTVGQFIVHTLNHPAGSQMVASLQEAGYEVARIPFIHMPWDQISEVAGRIYGSL